MTVSTSNYRYARAIIVVDRLHVKKVPRAESSYETNDITPMRRDRAVAGSVSHRPARRHPYGGAPENVLAVARGPSVNIPPNEPHHQSACLPRAKAAPVLLRTTPCVPSRKRIHTTMKNPSASPSHSQAWTAQPTKQSEGKEKSCHQRQR